MYISLLFLPCNFDWFFRSNNNGQIGREDLEEATIPVPIEIARPVTCVASGANHNLAITGQYLVSKWYTDYRCTISL